MGGLSKGRQQLMGSAKIVNACSIQRFFMILQIPNRAKKKSFKSSTKVVGNWFN
jgi:hypothetical protein